MKKMNFSLDGYNIPYSNFNLICRLCLATNESSLKDITETDKKDINLLKRIADLKISKDDQLPKSICDNCTQTIDIILDFITRCKRSQQVLTHILLEEKKRNVKTPHQSQIDCEENSQEEHHELHSDVICIKNKIKPINSKRYCQGCNNQNYDTMCPSQQEETNLHKCDFVNKELTNIRDKLEHRNVHTGGIPFKCSYCPKELKIKSKLKQHIYRHQLKLGLVEINGTYTEKRVHLRLRCNTCEKVFSSRSGFQYHKLKHDGKILQRTRNLKNKKSAKTFLCNYCAKSFNIKSNLDAHLRIHTGEKPFKCNYCSKEFSQKSSLSRHTSSHIDVKRQLFSCKMCQKKFTTKAHRDIHLRLHTGEKPYKCDFCQKRFNYKTQLTIHVRLHTGETPFACDACSNTYHDKGSLRKHQKKCNV